MKNYIFIAFTLLCSTFIFSQEKGSSKDIITVVLDGKPVLMNVKTGTIVNNAGVSKTKTIKNIAKPLANNSYNKTASGTHVVATGETLYGIARQYGISVNGIYKANSDLSKNSSLRIGQVLNLNTAASVTKDTLSMVNKLTNDHTNSYHIVKTGDTLYNISKTYGISVKELKSKNNLTSNDISIGQRLKI